MSNAAPEAAMLSETGAEVLMAGILARRAFRSVRPCRGILLEAYAP